MGERADEITERYDPVTGQDLSGVATETPYAGESAGTFSGSTSTGAGFTGTTGGAELDTDSTDPEIEASRSQIEETRAQMSETIDAIQQKLSPGTYIDQAKETVRDATVGKAQDMVSNVGDTARGAGNNVMNTIRANPVPAALAGIGLGWLFVSMRKNSSGSSGGYRTDSWQYPYTYSGQRTYPRGYTDAQGYSGTQYGNSSDQSGQSPFDQARQSVGNVAGQAQGKVNDTVNQVQSKVSDTAGQVQDTVSGAMDQAQQSAGQMVDQAQYGAQQAVSGFQTMLQENPLGVAAGALALGVAVGLAIPGTDKEDELMGETRDQLADRAQQMVQDTAGKVQAVAQEAVGAAKQEAQEQNLT